MHPDTAAGLIRSAAAQGGFTLTPEGEAAAAAQLAPLLKYDPAAGSYVYVEHSPDTVSLVDGQLVDVPLGTFVLTVAQRHGTRPKPASAPETKAAQTPPASSRWTGQTAAALARTGATVATVAHDAEQVEYARRLAAGPNPFNSSGNQTHRAFILKYLPEVAAQLRARSK